MIKLRVNWIEALRIDAFDDDDDDDVNAKPNCFVWDRQSDWLSNWKSHRMFIQFVWKVADFHKLLQFGRGTQPFGSFDGEFAHSVTVSKFIHPRAHGRKLIHMLQRCHCLCYATFSTVVYHMNLRSRISSMPKYVHAKHKQRELRKRRMEREKWNAATVIIWSM